MKSVIGKGVFKLSIILLACLMLSISLFGCVRPIETDDEFFEDGYFSFVKVYKNSKAIKYSNAVEYISGNCAIMLLDFTKDGKEEKVIDVPDTINGLPVISVSPRYYITSGHIFGDDNNYGHLSSDELKILYVNSYVRELGIEGCSPLMCKNLSRIIFNNQIAPLEWHNVLTSSKLEVVINNSCTDDMLYSLIGFISDIHAYSDIYVANIEYKYNYDTGTAQENYRIDLIKDKTEIPYKFSSPIRDGYTFGGWYLEPECETEWDRNIDCLLDAECGDIKFYAERNIDEDMPRTQTPKKEEYKKYISKTDKILRLYAKWIEN